MRVRQSLNCDSVMHSNDEQALHWRCLSDSVIKVTAGFRLQALRTWQSCQAESPIRRLTQESLHVTAAARFGNHSRAMVILLRLTIPACVPLRILFFSGSAFWLTLIWTLSDASSDSLAVVLFLRLSTQGAADLESFK